MENFDYKTPLTPSTEAPLNTTIKAQKPTNKKINSWHTRFFRLKCHYHLYFSMTMIRAPSSPWIFALFACFLFLSFSFSTFPLCNCFLLNQWWFYLVVKYIFVLYLKWLFMIYLSILLFFPAFPIIPKEKKYTLKGRRLYSLYLWDGV